MFFLYILKFKILKRYILLTTIETKESNGDPVITREYCPINGRFVFTYAIKDSLTDPVNECIAPVSEISNCPNGFELNLRFQQCSFGSLGTLHKFDWLKVPAAYLLNGDLFLSILDLKFQCLGNWASRNGERYLALNIQDSKTAISDVTENIADDIIDDKRRLLYRCAVYSFNNNKNNAINCEIAVIRNKIITILNISKQFSCTKRKPMGIRERCI